MTSPLNKGRTKVGNAKKQERHKENVEYRRSLHQQKSSARGDANEIQKRIDEISKRGNSK